MTKVKFLLVLLFTTTLIFTSCKKKEEKKVLTENYKGVLVVNEGGFNQANASLGIYKPGTSTYFDAYKNANNKPLGDIAQSISKLNNKFYLVVNNSNKIEVLNTSDLKIAQTVSVNSPRYVEQVDNVKAYVSSLFENDVKILKFSGNLIDGSIDIGAGSDRMLKGGNDVFVATLKNRIAVIDTKTDSYSDSINTETAPAHIVKFRDTTLAVLCNGTLDWNTGAVLVNAKIYFLNQTTHELTDSIALSTGTYGSSMIYNASSGVIYFSLGDGKIMKLDNTGTITEFASLPGSSLVYGLSNGSGSDIYATDAGDFSSTGKVFQISSSGDIVKQWSAGIAPNSVLVNE